MSKTLTDENSALHEGKPSVSRVPDSTNLSWLAETADGNRGEPLSLVLDGKKLDLVPKKDLQGKKELTEVHTPKKRPNRKKVTEVVCKGENFEESLKSSDKFDAVFWTESAVDKFLYPYYHAHRIWDDDIEKVKKEFDKEDRAVAIAHRAPSTSKIVPSNETLRIGVVTERGLTWMTVQEFLAFRS